MTRLSAKIAAVEESQTLALTRLASQLKARGVDVVSLTAGEPDFDTPEHVKEAAIRAIRENFTHYTANQGIPELIAAILEKFSTDNGLEFGPSQILVSCGAKHSIFNALLAICNPGDEVIIPAPYWVSYPEMAKIADAVPVVVPTTRETGYRIGPDTLRRAITNRSRVLVLNSPSNPTGAVYSAEELEALAPVIASAGLYVIADEIYEKILYDGLQHYSIGAVDGLRDRVITVNGVSKAYAMTGWRIGYMGGPEDVVSAAAKVQSQATSNANSIAQRAALAALTGPADDVNRMVAEFRTRRDLFSSALRAIPGIELDPPGGAFYLFPDVSAYTGTRRGDGVITGDTQLSSYLLEEAKVAVMPGSAFGSPGHLRLSYACSAGDIGEAARRLTGAFAGLHDA
ncbi:MAG TPA: pyridoxal phosphate-dependent aminotransferase [Bacteroidota bacterium]|nr:pyridoxal phosphate-dependent aminotransferase [Bacteroidota bacterium]